MSHAARLATAADLPEIHRITHAAYTAYTAVLGREPLPMRTDHAPYVKASQVWLVAQEGITAALAVLVPKADHLLILNLAIMPEAQGQGTGRWMLAFAEDQARSLALPELRLFTNAKMTRNLAIYAAAGYCETSRCAPDPEWPYWFVVNMVKQIA